MTVVDARVILACVGVVSLAGRNDGEVLRRRRQLDASSEASCSVVNERSETIIQTKQSLAAGAAFLVAPDVESQDDCLSACCNTPSCDTAVVKWKDSNFGCYLFNCGTPSVCTFSSHAGYSSFHMVTDIADTHADDLANLASVPSSGEALTTTTLPSTTTNIVTEPSSLYGACRTSDNCAVQRHLECLRGYCVCQPGYHTVSAVCRADCHRFQFECVNKDDPSLSECIAVYDRCNAIVQCRDGSDERDCPSDSSSDVDRHDDEPASSLSPHYSWQHDNEVKSSEHSVLPADTVEPAVLDQFSNKSQSKGVAVVNDGHSRVAFDSRNHMAASDEKSDADNAQQMTDSVDAADTEAGSRRQPFTSGSDTPIRTYKHNEISDSRNAAEHDSVGKAGNSVGRLTEEHRGPQVSTDRKFAEVVKPSEDGRRPAADDAVSERGHLLLSSMVDNSDEPKLGDGSHMEYPAAESGQKLEPDTSYTDSHNSIKDSKDYHKSARPKPLFGKVDADKSMVSPVDQSYKQPVDTSHHGTVDETHRLRKPDLGHADAGPPDSRWLSPEKSTPHRYDFSSSGKYTDYVKSDTRPHAVQSDLPSSGHLPSSSLPSHDSRPVGSYGGMSDSSSGAGRGIGGTGRIRAGLTEARERNRMDEKNRDRGTDTRGFLSNNSPGSRYDSHEGSQFRSHGKPSYSHSVESASSYEGSRHAGLVSDQSRYPSNSQYPSNGQYPSNSQYGGDGHDVLYGDSFYPASDDYYYGGGLAGPPGRAAGYDPQAPVDYDYYNMAPGVERPSSAMKTIKHSHGGQKAAVTPSSATVKRVQHVKVTTVKVTSLTQHQHSVRTPTTLTTTHGSITTSSVSTEMSPSSSTRTTPSPQLSSMSSHRADQKKPHHAAARKHVQVSAEAAHSAMLWSTAGIQGAVVALTLGIIITALTLAYIGCHYRHQRKISRRRRHLSAGSNDADYLVNGMYL